MATPTRNLPTYHLGTYNHLNHQFVAVRDENEKVVFWASYADDCIRFLDNQVKHGQCICKELSADGK